MREKKTELIIVTDNEELFNETYLNNIKSIDNISKIEIGVISAYTLAKSKPNRLIVCIIFDIFNLSSEDSFNLSYLINNNFFTAICTNDNSFMKNYCKAELLCDNNELINIIRFKFNPKNIIVGFITEDGININYLFADLLRRIKEHSDYNSYEANYGNNPISLHYFPKIFKGWIYDVWYGTKSTLPDTDKIPDSATIPSMITVKLPYDQSITYVWIKPSIETKILDEMGFHTLYIDINSHYKLLKLPEDTEGINLIPFIFTSVCNCNRDVAIMNMLHNLNLINEIYGYSIGKSNIMIDETSKSVYGEKFSMMIPNYYHINHIDPYLDLEEVIKNEPDGGTR